MKSYKAKLKKLAVKKPITEMAIERDKIIQKSRKLKLDNEIFSPTEKELPPIKRKLKKIPYDNSEDIFSKLEYEYETRVFKRNEKGVMEYQYSIATNEKPCTLELPPSEWRKEKQRKIKMLDVISIVAVLLVIIGIVYVSYTPF